MYASQHSLFARMRNISRLFCWKSTGFLPSANEVWGKVMFLHLSVRHSVHGGGSASWGSASGVSSFWGGVCIRGVFILGGVCIWGLWGVGIQGGGLGRPPPILWDTVNEEAVRILLGCILVSTCIYVNPCPSAL